MINVQTCWVLGRACEAATQQCFLSRFPAGEPKQAANVGKSCKGSKQVPVAHCLR